jgi:predicted dehydrogenase
MNHENGKPAGRREFLKASGSALAAAALPVAQSAYGAGSDVLRLGLIGCGGRGTEGAGQALFADKGVRLVALADMVLDRAQEKRNGLKVAYPDQVPATQDDCFAGFDAYRKVIEMSDIVIIANAAKFHPLHMKAAIEAGKHVFVEKPHAIDPAGIQVVKAACALAKEKKLSVLSGLHSRFHPVFREAVQRVHDGAVGEILSIEENFLRAPYVVRQRRPGMSELEHQAANQYHFHWLSGDDVPQSLIHNLDRASWVMGGRRPLKCHGMGGRSTIQGEQFGNVFDHHAVVYDYPDNVRLYAYCRTIPQCYNEVSSIVTGTKGRCNINKGVIDGENKWTYSGPKMFSTPLMNAYQIEQIEWIQSIRSGKPMDSSEYMVGSTLAGIMGQISCYSGKEVIWEQAYVSEFYYGPRPEDVRSGITPPVIPDANGIYPLPFTPGVSKLL